MTRTHTLAIIAAGCALLCAGPVMAEDTGIPIISKNIGSVLFSMGDGELKADWGLVRKCAETPLPTTKGVDQKDIRMLDYCFRTIQNCRVMIASRNTGWVEAGGDPSDPEHAASVAKDDWNSSPDIARMKEYGCLQ